MINLDSITNENNKKHYEDWPYIPDHLYRILIIGGSGLGQTNALINLINEQNDIDKIYLYVRDLSEPKYEYFVRCRKLIVSLVFITESYFSVPEDVRLNSTHYLIMKINSKRELQNIATNHSADIDCKDFMKIYRECTREPYNFLTIDTTLPTSNLVRFRKNFRQKNYAK